MKIFDTHCHLNLEPLFSGRREYFATLPEDFAQKTWLDHWQTATQAGVVGAIIPSADLVSSHRALQIAAQNDNLWAAIGLHPSDGLSSLANNQHYSPADLSSELAAALTDLEKLINHQPIAIGEIGLDYYSLPADHRDQAIKVQQELFTAQLELANRYHLPIIIHSRDLKNSRQVYDDIWEILINHYQFDQPFLLHCYSGPIDYLAKAQQKNAYISLAGNLTYPSATDLVAAAQLVDRDHLLVETDAPFLPPQAYRGQINQPQFINQTAQFLTNLLKLDPDQLIINAGQAFGISVEKWLN